MSGIGLGSGEMIHCSKPVIQKRPLLAEAVWKRFMPLSIHRAAD